MSAAAGSRPLPLRLTDVVRVYGRPPNAVRALDGVSLDVAEREVLVILGPSGSGKSTLLSIAGCLLRPTSGRVEVMGIDVTALPQRALAPVRAQHIGLIFQAFNLLAPLTAEENVLMPMQLAGVPRHEAHERARELLGSLGLSDRGARHPRELSGGEQQRVAIARSLANHPDVILADEPTASLDSAGGARVMELLVNAIRGGAARALVVVTHDQRVLDAADRVLWLEDGRLRDRP